MKKNIKTDSPSVVIQIIKKQSKYLQRSKKTKKMNRKDPLNFIKVGKIDKEASNKKVIQDISLNIWHSDSAHNLEIFKSRLAIRKVPLKFKKVRNIYIRAKKKI